MTKFLVSDANPTGSKLEDILKEIREDILYRCAKIIGDNRTEAQHVVRNNMKILNLLTEAIDLAEDSSTVLLKAFGRSSDKPRIGS